MRPTRNVALFAFALMTVSLAAQIIPNTGQLLTPTAPDGARFELLNPNLPDYPDYLAGQAVTSIVSPDHKTLLVLTSGFNRTNRVTGAAIGKRDLSASNEYVFVFDISNNTPIQKQAVQVPNTYNGIAFDPTGRTFYVPGGVDDNVHIFDLVNESWSERASSPVPLDHNKKGIGLDVHPAAAGIAVSSNGETLVVANYYNDSISVLTRTSGTWSKTAELDLRPGKIDPAHSSGIPGGEYPLWVAVKGATSAYVSSLRDREIDVIDLSGTPKLTHRIKVTGQPNKMTLNAAQTKLYVAEDQTDTVDIVDTNANRVSETIRIDPQTKYTGQNTNSVTLSHDEKTLYVTNGNTNNVAVIDLDKHTVIGSIPTGWYPTSVSLTADDRFMYVVNSKSLTGENAANCHGMTKDKSKPCSANNKYTLNLLKAGLQTLPTPAPAQLDRLTQLVAGNNHFTRTLSNADKQKMAFLHGKIKHVIFIIKENRTYDQVLGDLPVGNGDPSLTEFPQAITPSLHSLASTFVTLDNFYDRSEVSMDGWPWTTSARVPDVVEKQTWTNYGGRGLSYDSEGTNRNVNVALPTQAERTKANPLTPNDPDVLPGTADTDAPDGPDHETGTGYIWNEALRAGLTIRNYGFFVDLARYNLPKEHPSAGIPEVRLPYSTKTQVAYPANVALRPHTDIYFRGFDNSFPDYWRYQEWAREFDRYAKAGLPQLELVRFMHDHTGDFKTAIDGVNTVELQQADNDYAVGLLVEKISKSRYKNDTLIFVIEDDAQDGADHIDAHRSIAFIAGPYVKQGKLVSTAYNTVDFIRTIEEVLGLKPLNLNDSVAIPMADVFDEQKKTWSFTATPSALLEKTSLPIPRALFAGMKPLTPTHDSGYWAEVTKGMDFTVEDRIDFDSYNYILWKGLMGDKPYPETRSGLDLRLNREALLTTPMH